MFFICFCNRFLSLESDFPSMESRIIPYLASIIVENNVRAGFLFVSEFSLILAHFLDSRVFGISDLEPSAKRTI